MYLCGWNMRASDYIIQMNRTAIRGTGGCGVDNICEWNVMCAYVLII